MLAETSKGRMGENDVGNEEKCKNTNQLEEKELQKFKTSKGTLHIFKKKYSEGLWLYKSKIKKKK